jgi:hypothetical protein
MPASDGKTERILAIVRTPALLHQVRHVHQRASDLAPRATGTGADRTRVANGVKISQERVVCG